MRFWFFSFVFFLVQIKRKKKRRLLINKERQNHSTITIPFAVGLITINNKINSLLLFFFMNDNGYKKWPRSRSQRVTCVRLSLNLVPKYLVPLSIRCGFWNLSGFFAIEHLPWSDPIALTRWGKNEIKKNVFIIC